MTQNEINALLIAAVNDLWAEHRGGYTVKPDDPNRDAIIAAGKKRIAWIEATRAALAEASKVTS